MAMSFTPSDFQQVKFFVCDYSGSWNTGIPAHRGQSFQPDVDGCMA
jgi:hypothetical protein